MPRQLKAREVSSLSAGSVGRLGVPWAFADASLFTDVVVAAHEAAIPAHRVVLAARSRVLLGVLVGAIDEGADESPPLESNDKSSGTQLSDGTGGCTGGGLTSNSAVTLVALPVAKISVAEYCTPAQSPFLRGTLKVLYEGWPNAETGDDDANEAVVAPSLTLDETVVALAVLPRLQCEGLAASVGDSLIKSLDTSIEACLLCVDRIAALDGFAAAAATAAAADEEGVTDDAIAAVEAKTEPLAATVTHCMTVLRFMFNAAMQAVGVEDLRGLCLDVVAPPADDAAEGSAVGGGDVTVVEATPQLRSQLAPVTVSPGGGALASQMADATLSTPPPSLAATPLAFLKACVEMLPLPLLADTISMWAEVAVPRGGDSDGDDATAKGSMLGALVLLHHLFAASQASVLRASVAASEAMDSTKLRPSDDRVKLVRALAPLMPAIHPSVAIPLFSVASMALAARSSSSGGSTAESGLARACLLAAAEDPASFSATWVQHVADAHRRDAISRGTDASNAAAAFPQSVAKQRHSKRERNGAASASPAAVTALLFAPTGSTGSDDSGGEGANRTARRGPRPETAPLLPDTAQDALTAIALTAPVANAVTDAVNGLTARVAGSRDETAKAVSALEERVEKTMTELRAQVLKAAEDVAGAQTAMKQAEAAAAEWREQKSADGARMCSQLVVATKAFGAALEGLCAFEDELAGSVLPTLRQQQDDAYWELKTALETQFRTLDRDLVSAGHESPLRLLTAVLQAAPPSAQPRASGVGGGGGGSSAAAEDAGGRSSTVASATNLKEGSGDARSSNARPPTEDDETQ